MTAGIAAVLAVTLLPGCGDSKPLFNKEDSTRTYGCYMEEYSEESEVTVAFMEGGRKAIIHSRGERAPVEFKYGNLGGDHYRGGAVTLRVDPEWYVDGMPGGSRGPCF